MHISYNMLHLHQSKKKARFQGEEPVALPRIRLTPTTCTKLIVTIALVIFVLVVLVAIGKGSSLHHAVSPLRDFFKSHPSELSDEVPSHDTLHLLLPAFHKDIDLCKTLLSAALLGYPIPKLLAWDEHKETPERSSGSFASAKIENVLAELSSMDASMDDDLVIVVDAYDTWFQLPPATLKARYHRLNEEANQRLEMRLGAAYSRERIKQTILLGAGKRCWPNQPHTIACYPVPEPPISQDLYHSNTDTVIGWNRHYSYRQRYLNAGYMIGPVGDMRKLFTQAATLLRKNSLQGLFNDGGQALGNMPYENDQAIFSIIFGQQEFQREVLRRRYLTVEQAQIDIPPKTSLEGIEIADLLNPPFTHERMDSFEGRPYEFSIGLDYTSDLGHQTEDSELDAEWLQYNEDLRSQVDGRTDFDCKLGFAEQLPDDILATTQYSAWQEMPLYTHLCFGTIPVIIHHNGDKEQRQSYWHRMWFHGNASARLTDLQQSTNDPDFPGPGIGGAYHDDGSYSTWSELCPQEMHTELFESNVDQRRSLYFVA